MQQRAADGRHDRHPESMTSYQKPDKVSPAIFHPNPICNDGALGFFEEFAPTRTRRTRTR